jgi:plasmid maintenance system antidote protein VapI
MTLFELKKAILDSGFKQTYLASLIGIDQTLFSKAIHGHRTLSENQKVRLAQFLRKEVAELFPDT